MFVVPLRLLIVVFLMTIFVADSAFSQTVKVLWDDSHGERQPFEEHQQLVSALQEYGFEFDVHETGEILPEVLEGYDLLVVNGPFGGSPSDPTPYPFSTEEVEAIVGFVEEGHGLLLNSMMSNAAMDIANQVSTEFGVEFLKTRLSDPTDFCSSEFNPIIHEMISHPLTEEIQCFVLEEPGALELSNDAVAIAWADEDAESTAEVSLLHLNVIAIAERGLGRAAFVHDTDWFRDDFLSGIENHGCSNDNLRLGVNTMRWLAIPEPSSLVLLSVAVGFVFAHALRRRKADLGVGSEIPG